jgi:hypothetical protein
MLVHREARTDREQHRSYEPDDLQVSRRQDETRRRVDLGHSSDGPSWIDLAEIRVNTTELRFVTCLNRLLQQNRRKADIQHAAYLGDGFGCSRSFAKAALPSSHSNSGNQFNEVALPVDASFLKHVLKMSFHCGLRKAKHLGHRLDASDLQTASTTLTSLAVSL